MKYWIAIVILQICSATAFAQAPQKYTWLKGIILSSEDLTAVTNASVMVEGTNYGILTDSIGAFRLRVDSGAAIRITHLSFQSQIIGLSNQNINNDQGMIILLRPDPGHTLPPVVVSGADPNRFQREFMRVKISDSLNRNALANASKEKLDALRHSAAAHGAGSYSLARQKELEKQSLSNRTPYMPFFDVVKWYKVFVKKKKRVVKSIPVD